MVIYIINWYSVEQDITHGNVILTITVISYLGQLSEKKDELLYHVFANQLCLSRKFFKDDALDEYLQMPSKKATPNQPSIKEEAEEVEPITTSPGGE